LDGVAELDSGLGADVASLGGAFSADGVGFVGEGVDAGGVDPAIVEIEKCADGDGEVEGFIGPAELTEGSHVVGRDSGGIVVHFVDEAEQGLVFVVERGGFEIVYYAFDQFGIA
jgi:hypothetical protein